MLEEIKNGEPRNQLVVRLLNGMLRGCEFTLVSGKTLFIVTDEQAIRQQHNGTLLPDSTIYIPAKESGSNFEILVPEAEGEPVILREIQEHVVPDRIILSNEIISVGGQKLAWRELEGSFSDTVLFYSCEESGHADNMPSEPGSFPPKKQWWKLLVVIGIVGCVSFAGYTYLTETERQITSVADFLNNSSENYQIIYGNDKVIYVLSDSDKSAQWAIQSMVRIPQPYRTKVLTVEAEELRIGKWIESNWPQVKYHRVKLNDPKQPVLEISTERTKLSVAEKNTFTSALVKNIPYANSIAITQIADKNIKMLAADGLKKMALSFTEINNGNSVTFVIRGAIEDGELERLKEFITRYYQAWGGEYVQFALELKNDWLKGKSYKYGSGGYVKLAPGHWYFPRSLHKEL
ncbi:PrgH/EprH family type III secretion apparatus protein [Cedecea davisae]|uniref:PrgH/EprH family type III secretion apparatus protein n=1 Tax=Cedecea davisae TaxID=158484 RepID=A0ABS6DBK1_9ENTR|nr:PrgH/EprH family type III secretion apparatus protein [Cedecea davisae]MBU4680525.1 PrgH/EprH family type III secretion apparatus protein [Cedecea davisae]MBU4685017.1 PrgH/EprH family type III secretion apparatus protein [Cedecea davisae]